jgi:hypothetical protein
MLYLLAISLRPGALARGILGEPFFQNFLMKVASGSANFERDAAPLVRAAP